MKYLMLCIDLELLFKLTTSLVKLVSANFLYWKDLHAYRRSVRLGQMASFILTILYSFEHILLKNRTINVTSVER